jgi:hypothetical protein
LPGAATDAGLRSLVDGDFGGRVVREYRSVLYLAKARPNGPSDR